MALLDAILPQAPAAFSPVDRRAWRGVAHLLGLFEPAFLAVPDLAWIFDDTPERLEPKQTPASPQQSFVECAHVPVANDALPPRVIAAPRYSEAQLAAWARALTVG